ncbi:hypothetical protein TNCV_3947481 [Trichonephila clavipes]|nr:hypothetical protein TNCV_3947481 [Trichonephila clavipes]
MFGLAVFGLVGLYCISNLVLPDFLQLAVPTFCKTGRNFGTFHLHSFKQNVVLHYEYIGAVDFENFESSFQAYRPGTRMLFRRFSRVLERSL